MRYEDLPERWKAKIKLYLESNGKSEVDRLSSYDFVNNQIVKIRFEDGSYAEFRYAILIEAPEYNEVGLLTEHCGYHIFNSEGQEFELLKEE